jgi:hypothetical protein
MVFFFLRFMLDGRASALISPTGQGAPKVGRKNRVSNLVRQYRIEQAIRWPEYFHLPTTGCAASGFIRHKCKTGFATSVHPNLNQDGTFVLPRRELFSDPFDRQSFTEHLSVMGDSRGQSLIHRGNDEVLADGLKRSVRWGNGSSSHALSLNDLGHSGRRNQANDHRQVPKLASNKKWQAVSSFHAPTLPWCCELFPSRFAPTEQNEDQTSVPSLESRLKSRIASTLRVLKSRVHANVASLRIVAANRSVQFDDQRPSKSN